MAVTQTKTIMPASVIAADNTDTIVIIDTPIFNAFDYPIINIEITVGTFTFGVGKDAGDSAASYTVGDKLTLTLRNAKTNKAALPLHFKGSAGSDSFKLSF